MRGWKNIFHATGKQKKAGVAILISDKIDIKKKRLQKIRKYTTRGRHNNCKYLCTQHKSTSIHKENTNRHKRRN